MAFAIFIEFSLHGCAHLSREVLGDTFRMNAKSSAASSGSAATRDVILRSGNLFTSDAQGGAHLHTLVGGTHLHLRNVIHTGKVGGPGLGVAP